MVKKLIPIRNSTIHRDIHTNHRLSSCEGPINQLTSTLQPRLHPTPYSNIQPDCKLDLTILHVTVMISTSTNLVIWATLITRCLGPG